MHSPCPIAGPKICPATFADLTTVADLLAALTLELAGTKLSPTESKKTAAAFLSEKSHVILLAKSENQAPRTRPQASAEVKSAPDHTLGLAVMATLPDLWTSKKAAELRALYVMPAFRRTGIGQALIAAAKDIAAKAECAYLYAFAELTNIKAHEFFMALGLRTKTAAYFELDLGG